MRLGDEKPITQFEDRTGWTNRQQALHGALISLNPVYAYRLTRDALIRRGMVTPSPPLQFGSSMRGKQ